MNTDHELPVARSRTIGEMKDARQRLDKELLVVDLDEHTTPSVRAHETARLSRRIFQIDRLIARMLQRS